MNDLERMVARREAEERAELRDRFAVAAMQGLLSGGYYKRMKREDDQHVVTLGIAEEAYELADAMLAERELSADQLRERDGK